jgi:hypothetical protein
VQGQKIVKMCILLACFGCEPSSGPSDHVPVYSPVGIVITYGDSVIMQYVGNQEITGEFTAKTGTYTPRYNFRLIDVSGIYVTPPAESYELSYRVEDREIADLFLDGFDFYIKGKKPGRTGVILKVLSGASMLYTSQPLPTVVTE